MSAVAVLRWPADAAERWRLANLRHPRLLVLDPDVAAPPAVDDLEDVIASPIDAVEMAARLDGLRLRVEGRAVPTLDDDGLLRHQERWVSVTDAQIPVLRELIASFGALVRWEVIYDAYRTGGGASGSSAALQSLLGRLKSKIAPLGLSLATVRGRGLVLDVAPSVDGGGGRAG